MININEEIKKSMYSQDRERLAVLRGLKSALSNASLQGGNINKELSVNEFTNVVRKQVKQRQDSVALFEKGGRSELAAKEKAEIEVLNEFLPKSLTDSEIDDIVIKAIGQVQATTKRQMGQVMKFATEAAAGRVDGKILSAKISAKLI